MIDIKSNLLAFRAQTCRDSSETFRHIDEQVLHSSNFRLLAADTDLRAAFAACSFLTLEAKHLIFHRELSFI